MINLVMFRRIQWCLKKTSANVNAWTIQNKCTGKYAHPEDTPGRNVSIVEGVHRYDEWKIVSADNGEGGIL